MLFLLRFDEAVVGVQGPLDGFRTAQSSSWDTSMSGSAPMAREELIVSVLAGDIYFKFFSLEP
jgi:hypothetical protein